MTAKDIAKQAIIAAIYVVITIGLAPISYGPLQLRVAEMLVILPFFNRKHTLGLVLGCLIANAFSELGVVDMIFGTLATFIVCVVVARLPSMKLIPVVSAVVNGVIIGLMLHVVLGLPLLLMMGSVALSQLIVVQIGVIVFSLARHRLAFLKE